MKVEVTFRVSIVNTGRIITCVRKDDDIIVYWVHGLGRPGGKIAAGTVIRHIQSRIWSLV